MEQKATTGASPVRQGQGGTRAAREAAMSAERVREMLGWRLLQAAGGQRRPA